jgi:TRAP-type mannitol/chloroaromatic compound transport system substrate-binding protein
MRTNRTWLAAVAGAAIAMVGNYSAMAQTTKLKFQASFPQSSSFTENFRMWADRVKVISGGRLEIDLLPPGAVVPAFEVLDATHKRVIDGGHTAAAYWVGKNRAATLFGPTPGGPFGFEMLDYMGWLYDAGGLELYKELYQKELKRNVVPIPLANVANQILGWYQRPVTSWADLKGRKCRQTGITAEVFSKAGMAVVNMPGGEIVPAAQRGVIECAEWVGPAEDMKIGLHQVFKNVYMPSTHEPATAIELLINNDVYDKLGPDLQQLLHTAAWEVTFRSLTIINKQNAAAMKELVEKHGVTVHRTPDDILVKILEAWDSIAAEESARNPFFKKVYDSQRAYASEVIPTRRAIYPPASLTADYYWPQKKQ